MTGTPLRTLTLCPNPMRRPIAVAALAAASLALPAAAEAQLGTVRYQASGCDSFGSLCVSALYDVFNTANGAGGFVSLVSETYTFLRPGAFTGRANSAALFGDTRFVDEISAGGECDIFGRAALVGGTVCTTSGYSNSIRPAGPPFVPNLFVTTYVYLPTTDPRTSFASQAAFEAARVAGELRFGELRLGVTAVVPEPATVALTGAGVVLLGAWARRRRAADA